MVPVLRSKTLSVSIDCPPERVCGFVSNPENLPKWAKAFCRSVRRSQGEWIVETPAGAMSIRFVGANAFGVLDHFVSPVPGLEIMNPMRAVPIGYGSEVIFTLFQLPNMSEEEYAKDVGLVDRDLHTLKALLEA